MLEVTLAKANKFRNHLEDRTIQDIAKVIRDHQLVTFVGFEDEGLIAAKVYDNLVCVKKKAAELEVVLDAIQALRLTISEMNRDSGVDMLMCRISAIRKLHRTYFDILTVIETGVVKPVVEMAQTLAFENAKPVGNIYSSVVPNRTFAVTDDSFNADVIKSKIAAYDVEITDLEERRNAKNYTTTVFLSDAVVEVLRTYSLV